MSKVRSGAVLAVSAVLAGVVGLAGAAPVLAGPGAPEPEPRPVRRRLETDPFPLLSRESLFASLRQLTAIGSSSLFRNSASTGEDETREYLAGRLAEFTSLRALGLEVERQSFRTYLATEVWEARLHLTVNGGEVEVPAHALSGNREDLVLALRFDSDGILNDADRNQVVVQGPPVLLRSASEINALPAGGMRGRIALVDYAAIDRSIMSRDQALANASALLAREPAGLVLVTSFSNRRGDSHGTFVGDLSALVSVSTAPAPPTLYVRLEDLTPAGIVGWDDLSQVEGGRLVWDADILSPGFSGNVIARIPGRDPSKAVILGAHLDSPNSPGAMDDGSGTVVLLEVARVLDAARLRPPVDLVLAWFGSHERGLYGSSNFLSAHQELVDRTLAMLQVDCLSRPLDGIRASLYLEAWPYGLFGDSRLPWPDYLTQVARDRDTETIGLATYGIVSDNSSFVGYDVPSADLLFINPDEMEEVHYDGHMHDPYDTVELALEQADTLEAMARVALSAALRTGREDPVLRVTPRPD
ncbi:MAG TPA: M28 family metallopeptidase, partial [Thermoanaerobaculaceae bacterium]|nr:M28 family metallopeptidase [Thermoanaerobaculaceae bacterium]